MANQSNSSADSLEKRLENPYSIIDREAYSNIVVIPHLGANGEYLRDVVQETRENISPNQDFYVLAPYIDNTDKRIEFLQSSGIVDNKTRKMIYLSNKLSSDEEKRVYAYMDIIENIGGIDKYLDLISQRTNLDSKQALQEYENMLSKYKDLKIYDKIDKIKKNNQRELETILTENEIMQEAANMAFSKYSMGKLNDVIDELNAESENKGYGNFKIIGGSVIEIDNIEYLQQLQESTSKDSVHYIEDISELILGENEETYDLSDLGINEYVREKGIATPFIVGKDGIQQLNSKYTPSTLKYDFNEIGQLAQKEFNNLMSKYKSIPNNLK